MLTITQRRRYNDDVDSQDGDNYIAIIMLAKVIGFSKGTL